MKYLSTSFQLVKLAILKHFMFHGQFSSIPMTIFGKWKPFSSNEIFVVFALDNIVVMYFIFIYLVNARMSVCTVHTDTHNTRKYSYTLRFIVFATKLLMSILLHFHKLTIPFLVETIRSKYLTTKIRKQRCLIINYSQVFLVVVPFLSYFFWLDFIWYMRNRRMVPSDMASLDKKNASEKKKLMEYVGRFTKRQRLFGWEWVYKVQKWGLEAGYRWDGRMKNASRLLHNLYINYQFEPYIHIKVWLGRLNTHSHTPTLT